MRSRVADFRYNVDIKQTDAFPTFSARFITRKATWFRFIGETDRRFSLKIEVYFDGVIQNQLTDEFQFGNKEEVGIINTQTWHDVTKVLTNTDLNRDIDEIRIRLTAETGGADTTFGVGGNVPMNVSETKLEREVVVRQSTGFTINKDKNEKLSFTYMLNSITATKNLKFLDGMFSRSRFIDGTRTRGYRNQIFRLYDIDGNVLETRNDMSLNISRNQNTVTYTINRGNNPIPNDTAYFELLHNYELLDSRRQITGEFEEVKMMRFPYDVNTPTSKEFYARFGKRRSNLVYNYYI